MALTTGDAKNEPQRLCLVCGHKGNKRSLLRLTEKEGCIVLDYRQLAGGRGAYCCRKTACLCGLKKIKKRINKALRAESLTWHEEILSIIRQCLSGNEDFSPRSRTA